MNGTSRFENGPSEGLLPNSRIWRDDLPDLVVAVWSSPTEESSEPLDVRWFTTRRDAALFALNVVADGGFVRVAEAIAPNWVICG